MEHRCSTRRPCRAYAVVYSAHTGPATARVRDLSASGLFLETAARLPRHAVVQVAFDFGDDAKREVCCLAASVVRQDTGGIAAIFLDAAQPTLAMLQPRRGESGLPARAVPPVAPDQRAVWKAFDNCHARHEPHASQSIARSASGTARCASSGRPAAAVSIPASTASSCSRR